MWEPSQATVDIDIDRTWKRRVLLALRRIYFQGTFIVVERVPPQGAPTWWECRANAVLLYAPFGSQLTLLQHLSLQLSLLLPSPRYWPMADGSLTLDEIGRWRSYKTLVWLRKHGNDSIPDSIRGEMLARLSGRWVHGDGVQTFAPPGHEQIYALASFQ